MDYSKTIRRFLDLPSDVISSFCSEWLDVEDLISLDRIMNDSQKFFGVVVKNELPIIHAGKASLRLASYLSWSKSRSVQFKNLRVGERNWSTLIHPEYASRTQNIETLHIFPQKSDLHGPFRDLMHFPIVSLIRFLKLNSLTLEGLQTPLPCPLNTAAPLLEEINLSKIDFQDSEVLLMFDGCQSLRRVKLEGMRVPKNLHKLVGQLTHMHLVDCRMKLSYLRELLEGCSKLTHLSIHIDPSNQPAPAPGDAADDGWVDGGELWFLNTLQKHVPALTFLSLKSLPEVYDRDLAAYLQVKGKSIRHLELADSVKISDATANCIGIAGVCANIQILCLSGTEVTDVGAQSIFTHCTQLKSIDLSCCQVSDLSLGQLRGPNLTSLNLSHCSHVGNNGIRSLLSSCSHLSFLNIDGTGVYSQSTSLVTADVAHIIVMHGHSLKHLVIGRNVLITSDCVCSLLSHAQRLHTVELISIRGLRLQSVVRSSVRKLLIRRVDVSSVLETTQFETSFPFLTHLHMPNTPYRRAFLENPIALLNRIQHLEECEFQVPTVSAHGGAGLLHHTANSIADASGIASIAGFEFDDSTFCFRR